MDLHEFFSMEVKPAMGCTEPVAVALAAATAAKDFSGEVDEILLDVSLNIYKNGCDVGIPGTNGMRGNSVAAALGALAGDPGKGLLVLEGIEDAVAAKAKAMVDQNKVKVSVRDQGPSIYVAATLKNANCEVTAVIQDRHDLVHSVKKNGEVIYKLDEKDQSGSAGQPAYLEELMQCNMQDLWDYAGSLDKELEAYMLKGVDMNMSVAKAGLDDSCGLGIGYTLESHSENSGLFAEVKKQAGAASDVRMSGKSVSVMSSAGSGNHGITAIIPVAVVAKELNVSERILAESVALSHLVTGYVKTYTGRLTPICGCSVAAGAGAAAGIVRVMGGTPEMAERAVASLISSLMGMLCDGAKGSCGLKVSAAAGEAYGAALMAMDKRGVQQDQGLVSTEMRTTALALAELCSKAFANTDKIIVGLLQHRKG